MEAFFFFPRVLVLRGFVMSCFAFLWGGGELVHFFWLDGGVGWVCLFLFIVWNHRTASKVDFLDRSDMTILYHSIPVMILFA